MKEFPTFRYRYRNGEIEKRLFEGPEDPADSWEAPAGWVDSPAKCLHDEAPLTVPKRGPGRPRKMQG